MKEKTKNVFKVIKRLRYFLIFGIILLSINAYAWFVYITRVDSSITARVRSWNVMFQAHDTSIVSEVTFNVGEIYPGMPDYSDYATIINNGESMGNLTFTIKEVQIFENVYSENDYTTEELVDLLANNYPFKIDVGLTNSTISPGHTEFFNVDITWPYESGDDALDTYWGNVAYTYRNTTNSDTCISITAEIRVSQIES